MSLIDSLVAPQDETPRPGNYAQSGRSAGGGELKIGAVLSQAFEVDKRFAAQLALMIAFGLAPREAWQFRPHLALRDDGRLQVGSRVLSMKLSSVHHKVLAWARSFADARSDSMVAPGWTVAKCRNRFYHLCRRLGLTHSKFGVTSDLFRQSTLDDLHEWLRSHPEIASAGSPEPTRPRERREVHTTVSVMADHAEVYVVSAHGGGSSQPDASDRSAGATCSARHSTAMGGLGKGRRRRYGHER